MKILFTGGGTMGPVTPLLAVAQEAKRLDPDVQLMWIGTQNGPEGAVIAAQDIPFFSIPTVRFPRYVSLEWLLLPFRLVAALAKSWLLLRREKPDVIASAGGYTGVPVILVGSLMGIPSWIHQQDVKPLLSNKLTARFAKKITVAFAQSKDAFPLEKTTVVGNPVRSSVLQGKRGDAVQAFNLDVTLPTVLVMGGGTGSQWMNRMMEEIGSDIAQKANVIHLTGKGKSTTTLLRLHARYHAVEFLDDGFADTLAAADVVVARAGMGTISELAALKKAAILIPLPGSAQVANAEQVKDCVIIVDQTRVATVDVKKTIFGLLEELGTRKKLGDHLSAALRTDCAPDLARSIIRLANKS